ncbi:hypothetical protein Tco_0990603 [Tanacetum coccineum]|uniref:MAK10-like protein n=1 Tax=Tanacetum coccineum TaxID=301880 RepID=A0ABQ5EX65_9ASTR
MENLSQKHGLVSKTYYKNSLIMASTFGSKSTFFYDHVNPVTRRTIDQSAGGKLRDRNAEESWALLEDLALYDNESWNDPMDFAKLYFMEDPEQAFVEYASSRTDEVEDSRLSKFEADFKQQQNEMTNKIDTVLKAITDRIVGALPRDMVKNPKLSTSPVLSARSYLTMDPQCLTHVHGSINAVTIHPKQQSDSYDDRTEENEEEEKVSLENINVDPSMSLDPSVSFISKKSSNSIHSSNRSVKKYDDSHEEEPEAGEHEVDYFDIFLTRSELAYHKYLMCGLIPSIFLRNPNIMEGCPSNLKIPCNIGHVHMEKSYIDLNSPLNIMTRMMYNWIMRRKLDPRENSNRGVRNFIGRINGMHVFVGNFTYIVRLQ